MLELLVHRELTVLLIRLYERVVGLGVVNHALERRLEEFEQRLGRRALLGLWRLLPALGLEFALRLHKAVYDVMHEAARDGVGLFGLEVPGRAEDLHNVEPNAKMPLQLLYVSLHFRRDLALVLAKI